MSQWIQDMRYALRQLRRAPGFTATAILTLSLGIGATATMYSVVRDVLLAPLPYPGQDRLVGIGFTFPQEKPNGEQAGSSADFVREHSRSFESLGVADDSSYEANLSLAGGRSMRVTSLKVSQGYLPTLGVQPVVGRSFTAAEDVPGGPKVAMLSYWVWQRTFGGDPGIVNRVVRLNEESYTVIGVLPESMAGIGEAPDALRGNAGIWLPLQMSAKDPGYEGDNYVLLGRLRSGVTNAQAQQDLDSLKNPFYKQFPTYLEWTNKGKLIHEFRVWPLQTVLVSDVRRSLLVLLAAVSAVLLVACLNLAGLMTARAATRRREFALRSALGATRTGLLRLLVSESLVLAFVGGATGLMFARVARPALLAASPLTLPIQPVHGLAGQLGIVAFVMTIAMLTTLVCGLLPGWTVFRQDPQAALPGSQSTGIDASQVRMGKMLMVGQVAVAMVLLSAATLLLGSFLKLRAVSSGVQVHHLEIAQVSLKGAAYEGSLHTTQFVEKVLGELARYPGVERVAAANGFPLDRGLNISGRPIEQPAIKQIVEFRAVTPGYFRTLGIPLMMGRDLTESDSAGAQKVVLVNETAARKWWPGQSPIGKRMTFGGSKEPERLVVGVVADTRNHSLAETPGVTIYQPVAQMSDDMTKIVNGWFPTTFAIRVSGDLDLAAAVQKAVNEADPEIPVATLTTMQEVIDRTVAAPRFFSWMAGGFASFALLLTVIGLFGLLSYQVTQRTREIGVRMAIGSTRAEILQLILRRGLMLTAAGLALGGVASLAVPKVVASVLDDNVFSGGASIGPALSSSAAGLGLAALVMLIAAMLASYLPARRAAAVEPMEALRAE